MPRSDFAPPPPTSRPPRHPAGQALPPAPAVPGLPPAASILLVDDDPAVRAGLERVLAIEGWQVFTAASGEEALAFLARRQPDLMITDLRMTEVSGWDLLFHEKIQRPTLPIFVITALPRSAAGGADRFATAFFPKPLNLEHLVAEIHRCVGAPRPSSPPP